MGGACRSLRSREKLSSLAEGVCQSATAWGELTQPFRLHWTDKLDVKRLHPGTSDASSDRPMAVCDIYATHADVHVCVLRVCVCDQSHTHPITHTHGDVYTLGASFL